jgi:gas vesicle protein
MIPMPQLVVFVKVDKKEAIDRILGQFTQGGSLQSESYKGADIKYVNLPFGMAFQPAFCYVGDYFLFSLGREPIKGSVDSYSGAAKSLFENEDFKSINNGLMDPANKISFVKVDILLQKGKGICDWAVRWLTFMTEQQKKVKEMMAAQTDKLNAEIQSLEKELADINAKINDPANSPEAAAELVAQAKEKESMLEMNREQLDQFQVRGRQGGGPEKDFDAALVQLWLDKAVYPVIDGLQSLKAAGSKTVFTDKSIETEFYSKIVE